MIQIRAPDGLACLVVIGKTVSQYIRHTLRALGFGKCEICPGTAVHTPVPGARRIRSIVLALYCKRTRKIEAMAIAPRYTDEHAQAGLDFDFPLIETWRNQFPGYEIVIDDPEFTSVCPKTGLPDFGVITLRYMPREQCLELKSWKEYLFCYRNLGIFQENVVNRILEDVVRACDPVWAVVKGDFRPRGGISTTIEARWPRPQTSNR
jgi:7-cyano-7-deazaguanine reductase